MTCLMCQRTFSENHFSFNKKRNGYQHLCKECHSLDSSRRSYEKRYGVGTYEAYYLSKIRAKRLLSRGFRACSQCGGVKSVIDFYSTHARCKECFSKHKQMQKYGITCEGPCEICGRDAVHVDHDHRTQVVRGRLCANCNVGLGHFHDDPGRLRAAAEYLETRMVVST